MDEQEQEILDLYDEALAYAGVIRIDIRYDGSSKYVCKGWLDTLLAEATVAGYIRGGWDTGVRLQVLQEEFNRFLAKYGT
jgi:hypothetical protein